MKTFVFLLCILLAGQIGAAVNQSADRAWAHLEALKKGPGIPQKNAPTETIHRARTHLMTQERALADFLTRFPTDPRRFKAELEFCAVTASLGAALADRNRIETSIRRLDHLEKSEFTPSPIRAEAGFQRITTTMQTVNLAAATHPKETVAARKIILQSAQNFAARYPEDRRAARLLTEASTLFDDLPSQTRRVLEQAETIATDEGTRQKIRDDLRRLDLLGKPLKLKFTTWQGQEFDLQAQAGRIVILIFWASWSPPSMAWLTQFAKYAKELPTGRVVVATISLDQKKSEANAALQALRMTNWPTRWTGEGWDGEVVRRMGINALPTVFICDGQGRLRSLNARTTYRSTLPQLLEEKRQP